MNYLKKLTEPYKGLPKEIYILFIGNIINAAGSFIAPLMTLILTKKIGLSSELAGIYISIFGVIYLPTGLIGGKLTDMFGRKKIIIIFQGIACILYASCGFVKPSMTTIYLIMLAGAASGFVSPAINSMVGDLTEPKNRNASYALTYMGWNLGFAIGPFVGGLLFEKHLNILFIGDACTTVAALILIGLFVRETKGREESKIVSEDRVLEKDEEGSIFKILWDRKILLYFGIVIFGYDLVYGQWGFLLPIELSNVYGALGAKYYGYVSSFNGVVVILMTPIITKLFYKVENLKNIFYGGLFYTLGFGLLGFFNSIFMVFISVFIFTLGEIILATNVNTFIANNTPASHRGRMNGILPILMGAGYYIGPIMVGKILSYLDDMKTWNILSVIVLLSTIFVIYIRKIYIRSYKNK
ncbi:MDR family MFS transporter [Eubacterium multiforme]|uniref:MFS family permease n=1 Tax=Eubacterium multiforme TaxID=83339 RepID=A0ABT9UW61_9FIRM|nr:MFS transporter [Eubacterium multiforme]MDQ0150552.1 MFS family permease [Eubacterium multiforme]